MKEQTAVEWFEDQVGHSCLMALKEFNKKFEQAKAMESKERLKHLLFIGKVTEILGFDKVVELLKECNNEII
jgi:hypothetical protein